MSSKNREQAVDTNRKTAVIVGVLFIIATAFLFIGRAFYEPILGSADYLNIAYPNRMVATMGVLLEFACVLAIPLIPVFLFPVLRKFDEAFALGYFGFRFLEAVLFVLVQINLLFRISVSQSYINSSGTDFSSLINMGSAVQSWNSWAFSFYLFFFTLGGIMFYYVLAKSRLVPRFIAIWGLFAAALLLVGTVLQLLEITLGIPNGLWEIIFAAPIAINEMVLAVWLIVKGFNPAAFTAENGEREEQRVAAPSMGA